ncbi:putative nucleotidyltransferase substrate binding domain-containing protein [Anaerobacillus sp. CMMVII]|uniref:putative nucleotidyltransferase substrate binding domain-containing protein n=1 Tax=Anaerobacillus sp. CMMVII TaxID=2755588 RepID=UPI0021B8106C|nr:putative nucleotidyltransferase substrate binding domain-containing protein [Anaerobacillus sp. CMMVII]
MGIFGQLLPEEKGDAAGTINVKQTIFFPYVNSLRLLAMLEGILHSSTIERFNLLPDNYQEIKAYQDDFFKLLNYRLYYQKNASSYQKVHLLPVKSMNAREKEALKEMMKRGRRLFLKTKDIINQRCSR